MALKQITKDKIKSLGFDVDGLIAAIQADNEVDYSVPEVIAMTQAELDARDTNTRTAAKREGETVGEQKGKELATKALAKKFGIEETIKDTDVLAGLVQTKLATGDQALKDQIGLLQKDKDALASQITEATTKAKQAAFDAELIAQFPANRSTDLTNTELLTIIKGNLTFEEVDGKVVVKKGGEMLTDAKTRNPLPVGQAVNDYFNERKWTGQQQAPPQGGRGGKDNPPAGGATGTAKNMTQLREQWTAANPDKNTVSPEFMAHASEVMKNNPDFDYMS